MRAQAASTGPITKKRKIVDPVSQKSVRPFEPPCTYRNDPHKTQALTKLANAKALGLLKKKKMSI